MKKSPKQPKRRDMIYTAAALSQVYFPKLPDAKGVSGLALRGAIPARKINGAWYFLESHIKKWFQLGGSRSVCLACGRMVFPHVVPFSITDATADPPRKVPGIVIQWACRRGHGYTALFPDADWPKGLDA